MVMSDVSHLQVKRMSVLELKITAKNPTKLHAGANVRDYNEGRSGYLQSNDNK